MKLKISREDLLNCLDCVKDATDANNIHTILKNVLLRVKGGTLTTIATNHEIQMSTSCKMKGDDGERIVPAAKLQSILRVLAADSLVEIDFGDENATVKSGRSSFQLKTQRTDDYTLLGETGKLKKLARELSCKDFIGALRKVAYATAKETHRPSLTGILMEQKEGEMNFIATDAFRLARQNFQVAGDEVVSHIIPKKTADILLRLLKDDDKLDISYNERTLRFKTEVFELISNTIEENYPDYQSVIPRKNKRWMTLAREDLQSLARRAGALGEKDLVAVMDVAKSQVQVEITDRDNTKMNDALDVEFKGEEFQVGFNITYLSEALGAMTCEKLNMSFRDSDNCALLEQADDAETADGFCYVVMPMRL